MDEYQEDMTWALDSVLAIFSIVGNILEIIFSDNEVNNNTRNQSDTPETSILEVMLKTKSIHSLESRSRRNIIKC